MSIRSGHGSATHDRVLRLLPHFNTELAATQFALQEGLAWLAARGLPVGMPTGLPIGSQVGSQVGLQVGSAALAATQSRSFSPSSRSSIGAITSAATVRPVVPAERARQIHHRRATARTAITVRADRHKPA